MKVTSSGISKIDLSCIANDENNQIVGDEIKIHFREK
jgi:hypothetical protein